RGRGGVGGGGVAVFTCGGGIEFGPAGAGGRTRLVVWAVGPGVQQETEMTRDANQSPPNPLRTLHESAGAELQRYDQLDIVSTFGEPQAEYAAIHKGCALVDQTPRG